MKKITLLLALSITCSFCMGQKIVYDQNGHRRSFKSEDIEIIFSKSTVKLSPPEGEQLAPVLLAAIPTVLDIGFRLTEKQLEKSLKKWSAEYTKHKTYMEAGDKDKAPSFRFIRNINETGNGADIEALAIDFVAIPVPKVAGFVYEIDKINLSRSAAKSAGDFNTFDYSIEIKLTYLRDGKIEIQELTPLAISSVKYGLNDFAELKHITGLIPLPPGGVITEVSVKIIESNPGKVRAEKVLAFWNDNKGDARTVINNFLPEDKGAGTDTADSGKTVSSTQAAKK